MDPADRETSITDSGFAKPGMESNSPVSAHCQLTRKTVGVGSKDRFLVLFGNGWQEQRVVLFGWIEEEQELESNGSQSH